MNESNCWACPACRDFLRLGNLTCANWRFCRQFFSLTLAEFCNEVEEGARTTTACQCIACSIVRHVTYSRFRCPKWFLNQKPSNRTGDRVASVASESRWFAPGSWKAVFQCPEGRDVLKLLLGRLICCSAFKHALGFIFATLAWSARSPGFQEFPSSFTATNTRERMLARFLVGSYRSFNLVDEVCPWKGTYGSDGPKSYVLWRSMRDDAEGHHLSKWWFLC